MELPAEMLVEQIETELLRLAITGLRQKQKALEPFYGLQLNGGTKRRENDWCVARVCACNSTQPIVQAPKSGRGTRYLNRAWIFKT
jgi:hypothetical protein